MLFHTGQEFQHTKVVSDFEETQRDGDMSVYGTAVLQNKINEINNKPNKPTTQAIKAILLSMYGRLPLSKA